VPNGTKQEQDGSNLIDGCAKIPAWAKNVKPQYLAQCNAEANDIILDILLCKPLVEFMSSNSDVLPLLDRMHTYVTVRDQIERS